MSKPRGGRPRRSTTRPPPRATSDEPAFLAGIAAAPADDAPRLVYADWLTDHGQDARAEYVRLVVRLTAEPDAAADVDRCVELAADLDAEWRQGVGGVFEVTIDPGGPLQLLALAIGVMWGISPRDLVSAALPGQAVVLRTGITREEAEAVQGRIGAFLSGQTGVRWVRVRAVRDADKPGH